MIDFADPRKINGPGIVTVIVKEAYELPVVEGTNLYCKMTLLPWKERVKTSTAEVKPGKEIVWWNEAMEGAGGGIMGPGQSQGQGGQYSFVHLYNNETTPTPTLRVESWSSALHILDQMIGFAGERHVCFRGLIKRGLS